MIHSMESNDNGFTGLWSHVRKFDCGDMYVNSGLHNDLFFNKFTNITCINQEMINYIVTVFQNHNTTPYVYSLNYPDLDKLLMDVGFTHHDLQFALKRSVTSNDNSAIKISYKDIDVWSDIFCTAYDCKNWSSEIRKILTSTTHMIDYYVDSSRSSCMALYQNNNVLGLYCLGTIPEQRSKGIASSLIDFASAEVSRRNLGFLMLETYGKDDLLKFYTDLDFEKIYSKKIYTI